MKSVKIMGPLFALAIAFAACGGSGETEDPELKAEIIELEAESTAIDSTVDEIRTTAAELDAVLNELETEE